MKHLGNVLYVTTPEAYLSLDGENVVVKKDEHTSTRLPLHNLENIVCFTWQGASPGDGCVRGSAASSSPQWAFQARVAK
jgi:CRISPR-associated protein Cas1